MKDGLGPTFFALFGNKNVKKKKKHPTTSDRTAESLNVDIRRRLNGIWQKVERNEGQTAKSKLKDVHKSPRAHQARSNRSRLIPSVCRHAHR